MKRDFERYAVVKMLDARACLSSEELAILSILFNKVESYRDSIGKSLMKCVVVEQDWPEYEPTWQAIEKRVDSEQIQHKPQTDE